MGTAWDWTGLRVVTGRSPLGNLATQGSRRYPLGSMSTPLHNQHIQKSIIICSTGRSGSTLLCRSLEELNTCGKPEEYFHHNVIKALDLKSSSEKFLAHCNQVFAEGTTENGIFGIKMHWWQMFEFLKLARQLPEFAAATPLEILGAFFPNPKFIYIWRRNRTAQAVSTIIALQTGQWEERADQRHSYSVNPEAKRSPAPLQFQPLKIYSWEEKFKDQNARWRSFLTENAIAFREVITEELTSNFQSSMQATLAFIEASAEPEHIKMPTKKQSNDINRQFMARYEKYPKALLRLGLKLKTWRK
jgi:LPS sulfotransferase NodH